MVVTHRTSLSWDAVEATGSVSFDLHPVCRPSLHDDLMNDVFGHLPTIGIHLQMITPIESLIAARAVPHLHHLRSNESLSVAPCM